MIMTSKEVNLPLALASINEFYQDLTCGICMEVVNEPRRTICGHKFCNYCILKAIDVATDPGTRTRRGRKGPVSGTKCPQCNRTGITKRSVQKDENTEDIIKAIEAVKTELEKASGGRIDFKRSSPPYKLEDILSEKTEEEPKKVEEEQKSKVRETTEESQDKNPAPAWSNSTPPTISASEKEPEAIFYSPIKSRRTKRTLVSSPLAKNKEIGKSKGKAIQRTKGGQVDVSESGINAAKPGKGGRTKRKSGQARGTKTPKCSDSPGTSSPTQKNSRTTQERSVKDLLQATSKATKTESPKPAQHKVSFQWKGKLRDIPNPIVPAKINEIRKRVTFVKLGPIAKHHQSVRDRYPSFAEVMARRRSSGAGSEPSRSRRSSGDPPARQNKEVEDWLMRTAMVERAAPNRTETSTQTSPKSQSGGVGSSGKRPSKLMDYVEGDPKYAKSSNQEDDKRKRRASKDQIVKAALEGFKNKSRRRSKDGRLEMTAINSKITPSDEEETANLSIHNSGSEELLPSKSSKDQRTFMRRIIGDNDLYTSDEETFSQEQRRLNKTREESRIVKELALEGGRLVKKRKRIRSPTGSSEDEQQPSKKRTNQTVGSFQGNNKSPESSTIQNDNKENFASSSPASLSKRSKSSFSKLRSLGNGQGEEEDDTLLNDDAADCQEEVEQELFVPSQETRRSSRSSLVSTEESDLDQSTQGVLNRIDQLKAFVDKENGKSNASTMEEMSKSILSQTQKMDAAEPISLEESDEEDLFEGTPEPQVKTFRDRHSRDAAEVGSRRKLSYNHESTTKESKQKVLSRDTCSKFVLMSSKLSSLDREKLNIYCKNVGCSLKPNIDDTVTHLVVEHNEELRGERTMKYLIAVSKGKPVIGMRWIRECLEKEMLLDPLDYEVLDLTGEQGPRKSRLAKESGSPGLFDDFEFCLHGDFDSFSRDNARSLVQNCGGSLVRSYTLMPLSFGKTSLIVIDACSKVGNNTREDCRRLFLSTGVAVVDKDWIIESVGTYSIMPIPKFLQHDANRQELLSRKYPTEMAQNDSIEFDIE